MVNWDFPIEKMFMGYNRHNYNGAFPENVETVIKNLVRSPCLHLFSGTSKMGDVRVDIERKEATINMDVFEFIKTKEAQKQWKWCILDPPYLIYNPEQDLKDYGNKTAVSASIPKRNAFAKFFMSYCENVLWLDHCAPRPKGFIRGKVWFFFPGGYIHIRVLSWLKREQSLINFINKKENGSPPMFENI